MKINLLCSFLCLIFFASCSKNSASLGSPDGKEPIYLLTELRSGHESNGEEFVFHYNSDNSLNSATYRVWGGSAPNLWSDTTSYYYEYPNRYTVKVISDVEVLYQIFECDATGRPLKQTYYGVQYRGKDSASAVPVYNSPYAYVLFWYDHQGNLIRQIDSTDEVNHVADFEYDDSSNLISSTYYTVAASPIKKRKSEFSDFERMEAKVKPLYVLPFFIEAFPHPNNPRTREDYAEIEIDKSFGDPYPRWSTYDFHENGLLVRRSEGSTRTTYKYKKAQ